ncbi:hypothetical protein ACVOMV_27330 (plasmid) [Mesorhizobium atlanticum]
MSGAALLPVDHRPMFDQRMRLDAIAVDKPERLGVSRRLDRNGDEEGGQAVWRYVKMAFEPVVSTMKV